MTACSNCGRDVSPFERDMFTGACRACQRLGARPASLGCGTILLIAIAVWFLMRAAFNDVEHRQTRLQQSVDSLRAEMAQQTTEIRQLRQATEGVLKGQPRR